MNGHLHQLFPSPALVVDDVLPNNEGVKVLNRINELSKKIKSGGEEWLSEVYNSHLTHNCCEDDKFNYVHEKVTKFVNIFADCYGSKINYECVESWFNKYKVGDFQEAHLHSGSHLSAVYFVRSNKGAAPLKLISPYRYSPTNEFKITEIKGMNWSYYDIEPTTNRLVVFLSNMWHSVPVNKSNTRVTLAFNFTEKK